MAQREQTGNDVKQLPLRLDRELYQELSRRSTIENKSMSDIVRDALRAHFDAVRITKPQLRAAIERIAHEDAEILEAPRTRATGEHEWSSRPPTSRSMMSWRFARRTHKNLGYGFGGLPELDEVSVGIGNIATNFSFVFLRLSQKVRAARFPELNNTRGCLRRGSSTPRSGLDRSKGEKR